MILVMLGTNPYPFTRLLKAVDEWSQKTGEKVIAQTGHTSVIGISLECHDFVGHDQILEWIYQAEFVISQGGFGSLKDCIEMGKPIIAVPRYIELGESLDSQLELVDDLSNEGRVVSLTDIRKLECSIDEVRKFEPRSYNESAIPDLVAEIVDNNFIDNVK